MYEGGLRVPMVVRWPGKVKAGTVSDVVWSFADVMPTLADLGAADLPTDVKLDGASVLPTLLGKPQPELADRFLYWEFFEKGFQQAARWKNWKAVRRKKGAALELYDLAKDLGESADLASDHPAIVRKFEAFLEGARIDSKAWPLE
jgi:arylsulfatase A-like enzyme